MNLPGTALEFLDAFRGAYLPLRDAVGEEALEQELERSKNDEVGTNANARGNGSMWPMVHVHCFTKDLERPYEDICEVRVRVCACVWLRKTCMARRCDVLTFLHFRMVRKIRERIEH